MCPLRNGGVDQRGMSPLAAPLVVRIERPIRRNGNNEGGPGLFAVRADGPPKRSYTLSSSGVLIDPTNIYLHGWVQRLHMCRADKGPPTSNEIYWRI